MNTHEQNPSMRIKVWDPLVRFGHWALVAAFVTAYLSAEELLQVHVWAGYTVIAIVVIRLIWGLIGTPHARFSDFMYGPGVILAYLRGLLSGHAKRYLGHSPAGAAMMALLLLGLLGTTGSGLMLYAYEENAGPLAGYVTAGATPGDGFFIATAAANGDDDDEDEAHEYEAKAGREGHGDAAESREAFWEETHEAFVNGMLVLIALHIGGVLWASLMHRENLVAAMIHGRKSGPESGV